MPFLHGELQEDVCMLIPLGIKINKLNQVCKLDRNMYGLKQKKAENGMKNAPPPSSTMIMF